MKSYTILDKNILDKHLLASLEWVVNSIKATGGNGSAAYFHFWRGWSESYPETTGYLIDTLFDTYHITKKAVLKENAIQCANWLCSIQLPNGAFPGGIGKKSPPIIFDTGMIVFGLTRAWEETKEERYLNALSRSIVWLENQLDTDGMWRNHSYVNNFSPSYYTMVIWAILKANKHLKKPGIKEKMKQALGNIYRKLTPALTIKDWGFKPDESAFTHTIAYTLQGMFEAGLLLEQSQFGLQVNDIAQEILTIRQKKGKLAGSYDKNWNGDYAFGCLTGQAQMSIIYFRLFQLYRKDEFLEEAQFLLWQMLRFQSTVKIEGWYGGIPGSAPVWGKYQRFQFPNWSAKFFLDALMEARKYC